MNAFMTEAFTLLALGAFVILLRTLLRAHQLGIRHLRAEDYLMLCALASYAAGTAIVYVIGVTYKGLANSSMTDIERVSLDPASEEYRFRVAGSKLQVGGWCLYATLLWLIKASLCSFYLRLTAGLKGFETRVKLGFLLLAVTYIALICSILFSCRPINRFWQIYPDPGSFCQPALSRAYLFTTLTLNLSTDLYLVLIPVPMLWKAKLAVRKKIGLTVLFSGALFVIIAGVLRCTLTLKHPITGPARGAAWALRECFVAIVTSNLPLIWPWIRQEVVSALGLQLRSARRVTNQRIMLADRDKGSAWYSRRNKSGTLAEDEMTPSSPTALTPFNYEDIEVSEGICAPPPPRKVYVTRQWDVRVSKRLSGDRREIGLLPTIETGFIDDVYEEW